MTDEQLDEAESFTPGIKAHVMALRAQAAAAPAATPAAPKFNHERLPEAAQEIVDGIPDLLDWQISADKQHLWRAAKAMDDVLLADATWKSKPAAERMQEVVTRVSAAAGLAGGPAGTPAAAPGGKATLESVQAAIDAAAAAGAPVPGVGAFRSGASPGNEIPDFHTMARQGMSDEDIMARLN